MASQIFSIAVTAFGLGFAFAFVAMFLVVKFDLMPLAQNLKKYVPALLVALLGVLVLFGQAHGVRADTPVPLTIPTNQIFTSANDWITTFAPIAAIGIGISIALAVLGYLGKMIVSAFRA